MEDQVDTFTPFLLDCPGINLDTTALSFTVQATQEALDAAAAAVGNGKFKVCAGSRCF